LPGGGDVRRPPIVGEDVPPANPVPANPVPPNPVPPERVAPDGGYTYRPEDFPFGGYPGDQPVVGLPGPVAADEALPVASRWPSAPPASDEVRYPFGRPATMPSRLAAKVLDALIVGLPLGVVLVVLGGDDSPTSLNVMTIVITVATLIYEALFLAFRGATPGKRACGIAVVDERTGHRLSVGRAFLRAIVQGLSNYVFLAGAWSPLLDRPLLRGWHDKAAGDIVVSTR
jgi:uncharacterized RDD family membrane protein YckC